MSETEADKWGWWAGPDQECYRYGGPFATREAAIQCGRDNDDGDGFFIVQARLYPVRLSAQRLLEQQYHEDEDGFDFENVEPDRVGPPEAIKAADDELQALLNGWVEKHRATFTEPNMFMASRGEEWIEGEPEATPSI